MSQGGAGLGPMPITDFEIGAVIRRSFLVLFKNFGPFILLSLIFMLPSQFPLLLASPEPSVEAGGDVTVDAMVPLATFVVHFLSTSLLSATLVYGTIIQLRGGHATAMESVVKGLGLLLPVIGVSLLAGLITLAGMLLLIVPGILAFTVLWVAVPAAVVERPGIVASLRRSAELTDGYRWRVLGVIAVILLISAVIEMIVVGPLVATMNHETAGMPIGATIILLIVQAFFAALSAVTIAVSYHDLRITKEGVGTEHIAAVFD
ncbi:MAG: hypothetical protein WD767_18330 [Alphaproteobacteria bacterium]